MPAIEWSLLWHERNKIDQGPNASNAHKMPGICLEKPRPALWIAGDNLIWTI